jgi:hypothetical protein
MERDDAECLKVEADASRALVDKRPPSFAAEKQ